MSTTLKPAPLSSGLKKRVGYGPEKGVRRKHTAASPNRQWTEYEMQSIDEWIARQDVKLDRPEAIRRRLVDIGLKVKAK